MSLHAGEVPYDPRGVYGRAVIWAFRLVDAKLLKAALADSSGVLAIIASSWFFEEVVQHAANGIPSTYRRVLVRAKESTQPGWICLPDDTTPVVEVASPYQGLRAFGKQDKRLFFGRETAIRDLAKAVARSALVPVVGKSGVGKSSLVQAGLLPSLKEPAGPSRRSCPGRACRWPSRRPWPGCPARPDPTWTPGRTTWRDTVSPRPPRRPERTERTRRGSAP
jgi:hypothetical protein